MIQGFYFIIQTTAPAVSTPPAISTASGVSIASESNSSAAVALPTTSESVTPSIATPSDPLVSSPAPLAPSSGPPAGELSLEEVINRATIHNATETPAAILNLEEALNRATISPKKVKKVRFRAFVSLFISCYLVIIY